MAEALVMVRNGNHNRFISLFSKTINLATLNYSLHSVHEHMGSHIPMLYITTHRLRPRYVLQSLANMPPFK